MCVSGSVCGLSYRSRIDEETCVALLPNGKQTAVNHSSKINNNNTNSTSSINDNYNIIIISISL